MAFGHSSLARLEISPRLPTPKGPPSSLVQLAPPVLERCVRDTRPDSDIGSDRDFAMQRASGRCTYLFGSEPTALIQVHSHFTCAAATPCRAKSPHSAN